MAKDRRGNDAQPTPTTIRWDHANMNTSYANVVNVSSTREEVTLLFGTNQTWHTGTPEFTVKLSDRIIISPFAAKRLLVLLQNVVGQYEQRFGQLDIGAAPPGPTAAAPPSQPAQVEQPAKPEVEEVEESKEDKKGGKKVN